MGQYDRVMWRGEPVTRRQRQAMLAVEKAIQKAHPKNHGNFQFDVPQGSWQPITPYSGTTHHGAGVLDVFFEGMSDREWFAEVLRITRRVGHQAAFGRGPWCSMSYHFHICDLDTRGMDPNAQWQVSEYRAGNDGLVYGRNDPFPYRPKPLSAWKFRP
jgi:hypothetical protein